MKMTCEVHHVKQTFEKIKGCAQTPPEAFFLVANVLINGI
jgi:hypothetical protein